MKIGKAMYLKIEIQKYFESPEAGSIYKSNLLTKNKRFRIFAIDMNFQDRWKKGIASFWLRSTLVALSRLVW